MSRDFHHEFQIKSLKVDGRAVPFDYVHFANDYDGEMHLVYNLDSGVRRRFWHVLFVGDFPRLMRAAKYPDAEDKEVEVEAKLVPENANGAAREIPVRGRALRELIGVESKEKLGAKILAIHSLQLKRPDGAQGAAA